MVNMFPIHWYYLLQALQWAFFRNISPIPRDLNPGIFRDDVIKWKHFSRYWPFVWGIHRSPVNSHHKGQWRGALMFSLICVWTNDRVNNRDAGDLRRHCAHYDVSVMCGVLRIFGYMAKNIVYATQFYAGTCYIERRFYYACYTLRKNYPGIVGKGFMWQMIYWIALDLLIRNSQTSCHCTINLFHNNFFPSG